MHLASNGVNAASWTGSNKNINLYEVYATGNSVGFKDVDIPITSSTSASGVLVGCTGHYRISGVNLGTGNLVTTYQNNGKLRINLGQTGIQDVYVTTALYDPYDDCGGWGSVSSPSTTTVRVIISYSSNFRTVAERLGIIFSNENTEYNLDNINVYPEDYDKFEAILGARYSYNNLLNDKERELLDTWIASKSNYSGYLALYNAADAYLTSLANEFIFIDLQNQTLSTRTNYNAIIEATDAWMELKEIVQNRVIGLGVNYPDLLISAKANRFIHTYNVDNLDSTYYPNLTKEVDQLILSSFPAWTLLNVDVKDRVWNLIKDTNTIKGASFSHGVSDFVTWIYFVQNDLDIRSAEEFVNRNRLSNYDTSIFEVENFIDIVNEGNEEEAARIVGVVLEEYEMLSEGAKARVFTDTNIGTEFLQIVEEAQNYLDALAARAFIDDNKLRTEYPDVFADGITDEVIEEYVYIAANIVDLDEAFGELNENTQNKVVGELDVETFQVVIDKAQDYLDSVVAKYFIDYNQLRTVYPDIFENIIEDDQLEELVNIAINIVDTTGELFANLNENTQGKVLTELEVETYQDVIDYSERFLYTIVAKYVIDYNQLRTVYPDVFTAELLDEEIEEFVTIAENIVNTTGDIFANLPEYAQDVILTQLEVEIYQDVIDYSQDFLDSVAAKGIIDHYEELTTEFPTAYGNLTKEEINEFAEIATSIVGLEDDYNELTENAKAKVLEALEIENFQEIIYSAQEYLEILTAFPDVKLGEWYTDGIMFCRNNGLITGYTSGDNAGKFGLNDLISRGQFITILYRMAGQPEVEGLENPFTDVPVDAYYANAIKWAVSKGITTGKTPTTFDPNGNLTRQELAVFLERYAREILECNTNSEFDLSEIADYEDVADWATDSMKYIMEKGVITGDMKLGYPRILPNNNATRAEAATMIMRFCINV